MLHSQSRTVLICVAAPRVCSQIHWEPRFFCHRRVAKKSEVDVPMEHSNPFGPLEDLDSDSTKSQVSAEEPLPNLEPGSQVSRTGEEGE